MDPTGAPNQDKVYVDEAYVCLKWDRLHRWLDLSWKAFANSAEFRSAMDAGINATRENRATKWLVDGLNMRVVPLQDQKWIIEEWVPRVISAGARYAAFVIPKSEVAKQNMENMTSKVRGSAPGVEMQFFSTRYDAEGWLTSLGN